MSLAEIETIAKLKSAVAAVCGLAAKRADGISGRELWLRRFCRIFRFVAPMPFRCCADAYSAEICGQNIERALLVLR